MDPITASILAALAAGIAEGIGATAYNALKDAIQRKFGKDSKLSEAITTVEQEPDFGPNQTALAGRVEQTNAAQDPELLKLAQALTTALEKTSAGQQALSKYNIQATDSEIGVIGDNAQIKGGIHFGNKKK
ncbi:MAG: hypothetical protein JXA21_26460 [Anaerolineae bacterium]|nr:hypothetical protein [Anaerolineae bacterium]